MHQVVSEWRSAPLSEQDRALCEFAARLTHRQEDSSEEHLDRLRSCGLSDRAIHDAVQVIGYFNYITRIADALGVEPESFIPRWGCKEPPQA